MTYRPSEGINIFSDSKLAVYQLNNKWKIINDNLRKLNEKCKAKIGKDVIYFHWIPRETNPAGIRLEELLKDK